MRRPLRIFIDRASAFAVVLALVAGPAVLAGCDDPRSLEWQAKHVTDTNPMDRSKAIDGISQSWRNTDQSNDDAKKAEFRDKAADQLAKAYTSDALKDLAKERKKLMDILSMLDDKRARPAFIHAFKNYKPGDNDDEVKAAVRAVIKNKALFQGDDELAKAMLAGLKNVKFAAARSGEIGAMFGDAIGGLKAKGVVADLLAIVTSPNDGMDTIPNKELVGRQAICAQALGEIGDVSVVHQLIDVMFDMASRMAVRKDKETGDEVKQASPLTSGVSMLVGGAVAKLGEAAVEPLMPFVVDDVNDPKVKEVAAKFKEYISPSGSGKPKAYQGIATQVVVDIGLPKVAEKVRARVRDKDTKDGDRTSLVSLLVSLPADKETIKALQEGFEATKSDKLKNDMMSSASRLMSKDAVDWVINVANTAKTDELKAAALGSALWLAPKERMGDLKGLYERAKLLDKPDPMFRVMEATDKECDPTKLSGTARDNCQESVDKTGKDGKPVLVMWVDKTPKYKEEVDLVAKLVNECDKDAKCYFQKFQESVKVVDKQGFTKVTVDGTYAMIRLQKAIWMLAMYGTEETMVDLVKFMPTINSPAPRSFVQMAIDKNLIGGSTKVAETIADLVKKEREKGSETANREAAQLEPIATKLRARAASSKK